MTGAAGDDWTVPGAFEVAPSVYRIPLPLPNDGLRAVNVYAVLEGGALCLVDGGWAVPEARSRLGASLRALGCGVGDIAEILVTHVHRDHYTQAVALRREGRMAVRLGRGEREAIDTLTRPGRVAYAGRLAQLRRWGAGDLADRLAARAGSSASLDALAWAAPDTWLGEGSFTLASGRRLEVVETPGHTRGHVVFHDVAARLLFAGDHVLPTITPSIGLEPVASPNPLGSFLASLARVRAMPDALLLPAHGPVASSVHARIDELVDHHGRRLDATVAAVLDGASSAYETAGRLRWTRREREFEDLDAFNQMLAVTETAAHLDLLVAQGRLVTVADDGVDRYLLS